MYQTNYSAVQKAGLISKEYHSCIILESIGFFGSIDDLSKCLAVVLLVNRWKCWGGCSELAGTGRPGGPVGQVELEGPVGLWARWKAPPHSPDQLAGARQVPN